MLPTVRVIAAPGALLPYYAEDGRAILGRFVGMGRAGAPAAETVARTPYITRALSRGDIVLAPDPDLPAPPSPTDAAPTPALDTPPADAPTEP